VATIVNLSFRWCAPCYGIEVVHPDIDPICTSMGFTAPGADHPARRRSIRSYTWARVSRNVHRLLTWQVFTTGIQPEEGAGWERERRRAHPRKSSH